MTIHTLKMSVIKELLPGATAGFTGVLIGYPLDTVKVRMQTGYYPHMLQCIYQTTIKEGPFAFYRGSIVPFTAITIKRSYQYYLFDITQKSDYKLIQNPFISGAVSGVMGTPLGCPMHVVKIRMQNSNREQYKHAFDCIRHIYRTEGPIGFFSGFKVNAIKDCCFGGLFLGTIGFLNNHQKKLELNQTPVINNMFSLFKGGIAGTFTWSILFPMDTVKTMVQSGLGYQMFKKNVRELGYLYMWRGIQPVLIRTFPASAISVLVYDKVKDCVNDTNNE